MCDTIVGTCQLERFGTINIQDSISNQELVILITTQTMPCRRQMHQISAIIYYYHLRDDCSASWCGSPLDLFYQFQVLKPEPKLFLLVATSHQLLHHHMWCKQEHQQQEGTMVPWRRPRVDTVAALLHVGKDGDGAYI